VAVPISLDQREGFGPFRGLFKELDPLRGANVLASSDQGQTWTDGLVLDERKGVSYPDGFQAPDGTIYSSYDRNRATDGEILLARFTEADVAAQKLVGPKSKLQMLISRPLVKKASRPE